MKRGAFGLRPAYRRAEPLGQAEPTAAADRAVITAFRVVTPTRPARLLSWVVRRRRGDGRCEVRDQTFRDLAHVKAWLQQFDKPEVATSTDEATVQMVAVIGQALRVIVEEIEALKAAAGRSGRAEPDAAPDRGGS